MSQARAFTFISRRQRSDLVVRPEYEKLELPDTATFLDDLDEEQKSRLREYLDLTACKPPLSLGQLRPTTRDTSML